jgi:hypothetical protein
MQAHGDEDYEQRYVVPESCVDFLILRPYEGFIEWCQNNWLDLFIFGWDWRRGTEATADFFLDKFLPKFESRVSKGSSPKCSPPPLNNFWLIGHSFGGSVIKQILNRSDHKYVKKMTGAISVATPFYGYGSQVHRYFKGDLLVNWTKGRYGAGEITKALSTMPAGYELLFLDQAAYNERKAELAADPEGYNLTD